MTRLSSIDTPALVLSLGFTQIVAWASSVYLPAIVAAPIAAELGIARGTVFGAYSVALLVMAAAGPLVGRSIDASGGRRMLCLSNVVLAVGLGLLAAAPNVALLFGAWCVLGVGMAMGLYDAAFASLVQIHGRGARPAITGITLLGGFASTVGWALSAWIAGRHGWRVACAGWALLHIFVAWPLNRLVLPVVRADLAATPAGSASPGEAPLPNPDPQERRRGFALLLVFFACTAFVTSAMAAHLPGLLQAAGASAAAAVAAAALLGPAQVAARALEFVVARSWQVHPLVTARVATMLHPIGGAVLIGLAGLPAASAAFALLHGAGNGMITIAKGMLPLALFGPAGYATVQGLLSVLPRIAQAAAPLAFGLVLDGLGAGAAVALSGGLSLAALLALLLLRARG